MSQIKKQFATLGALKKKIIKYLTPYFYQGGKWFPVSKLGGKKNGRRKSA